MVNRPFRPSTASAPPPSREVATCSRPWLFGNQDRERERERGAVINGAVDVRKRVATK